MIPSTHLSILNALHDPVTRDEGWKCFQKRYQPTILRWSQRHGLQEADAEDVTQQVLISLFRRLPEFQHDPDRARFRTYIQTVVAHAVIDLARSRKQSPHNQGVGGNSMQDRLACVEDDAAIEELIVPFEEQLSSDCRMAVEHVQQQVSAVEWSAFSLTLDEKLPIKEVAEQLSLPIAKVYKMRFKVSSLLREAFGEP